MKNSLVVFIALLLSTIKALAVDTSTLFVHKINDGKMFQEFGIPSTGIIRQGEVLKFLIDRRDTKKPEIYYINSNYCGSKTCKGTLPEAQFHYDFAKKVLKKFSFSKNDFTENAYSTTTMAERLFYDGRIQKFTITQNGIEKNYYGVRFIERDLANQEMIQFALEMVNGSLKTSDGSLAFMINGIAQKVDQIAQWAQEKNIPLLTMEELLSGVDFIGLNPGVAYGFVRYAPKDPDDLEAYEIPVFEEMPLDLSVVAGTISTQYQDTGSHINLKSKERGTPNMVLRDPKKIAELRALDGMPIKLTVEHENFEIVASDKVTVINEYNKKLPKKWQKPSYVLEKNLIHFDDMCIKSAKDCLDKAKAYGGKVSGLGFLAHKTVIGMGSPLQKKMGYRLNPLGFGVPLTVYKDFIEHNKKLNPAFKSDLEKLINSEMSKEGLTPLPTAEKKALILKIREHFLKAEIPKESYVQIYNELGELKKRVATQYPGVELNKLKIRSSANTEDVEGFNGAGLHDSFSAKIDKSTANDFNLPCKMEMENDEDTGLNEEDVKPKSIACAIKADFASLWTLRAVRERSFKRFDHSEALMGLSVQPSYKFRKGIDIVANSVLITRVMGTESVYGHQLSTQLGNGLVTNPALGTRAELAVIAFAYNIDSVGINILQYAKPHADKPALSDTVMSQEQMILHSEIAKAVETPYCEAKPGYYVDCKTVGNSVKKKFALDMEFKTYSNGEILVKQARLYSGK